MTKTNEPNKRVNKELAMLSEEAQRIEAMLTDQEWTAVHSPVEIQAAASKLLALNASIAVRHFAGLTHSLVGTLSRIGDGLKEVTPNQPDLRPLALIAAALQPVAQAAAMQANGAEVARVNALASGILSAKGQRR